MCNAVLTTTPSIMLRRCETCSVDIDEELLAQLKEWRLATARELSVPAYVVFTDNTLIAIAESLPTDDAALVAIPGIGALQAGAVRRRRSGTGQGEALSVARMTWSERERELLAVTLQLLRQRGYDGLTVDDVVAEARPARPPCTEVGPPKPNSCSPPSSRGSSPTTTRPTPGRCVVTWWLGDMICGHAREHAATMRGAG